MTPERWHQIEVLLDALLDLEPDARAAVLDDACADDGALRRDVEALLQAEAEAPAFLEEEAAVFAAPAMHAGPESSFEERRIGAYRLVREIGRGGMGTVYLAERADGQFEQRVAVKVIKRGMDTDAVVRRFQYERQILARLQHPHVARLYDGGITDDGLPYFVMAFVEGEPLTAYCDRHRLPVTDRLALFETVCEAVQYAHRNLVVHRDLKPPNILVTGDGQVKLLDFGIAKLLDPAEAPLSLPLTQAYAQPMTPEYAAPEQVRGEPVTTATDVYALGVILYELLTGARPYRFETRSPTAIERIVSEHVPARPSTKVGSDAAASRATEPKTLRHRLAGDLDAVTLQALKKEPALRYPSAAELLDDLRRHRQGLPVAACDDTARYRTSKFVGRHKMAVALGTLAVLALMTGLAVSLWQATVAARERDAKELEAARAREMVDFAVGLFDVVDPQQAQGAIVTAQDLIDTGLERAEALEEQPEQQAAMLDVMGRVSFNVAHYARADSLFRRAVALKERALGPEDPRVAESLFELGHALLMQDSLTAAEAVFDRARAIQARALGSEDPGVMKYLNALAFAYFTLGEHERPEQLLRDMLAHANDPAWRDHPEMTEVRYTLARVLDYYGEHDEAEALFRDVLAGYQARLGPEHSEVADVEFLLARNLANQDKLDEAAERYTHARDVYRQVYGEQHLYAAMGVYALAQVQQKRGAYAEAAEGYREAAALYETALPGSPWQAYALVALGQVLLEQHRPGEAEAQFRHGLDLYAASPNPDAEQIAVAQSWLGRTLTEKGRYAEAEPLLLAAHATLDTLDHRREQADDTRRRLAALYQAWNRPDEAARYESFALEPNGQPDE